MKKNNCDPACARGSPDGTCRLRKTNETTHTMTDAQETATQTNENETNESGPDSGTPDGEKPVELPEGAPGGQGGSPGQGGEGIASGFGNILAWLLNLINRIVHSFNLFSEVSNPKQLRSAC